MIFSMYYFLNLRCLFIRYVFFGNGSTKDNEREEGMKVCSFLNAIMEDELLI